MLSYISLHRGAPKRVKACQIAWGNYRAWSGAIYWIEYNFKSEVPGVTLCEFTGTAESHILTSRQVQK